MPARPCLACGALTREGSYCRAHRPSRVSPGRTNPARFRRETLAKTGGACARCGSTDRVEAHHLTPLVVTGGGDAQGEGVPLCHQCHRAAHLP